ncbi:hypothetical protein [Synechococcus elongatus]|uniref:hypothetical protein n=1 Tax=Synechococcus elongatus TaxID=32046 RepID=UPI000F7DEF87|nr:hypothetical protein [Synechococcus elongatus]
MRMTESLERAQQGDANSIAALLDTQLRPQGVTVSGQKTSTGLQLRLKGVTAEQQILLRPYLTEVLHQLQIPVSMVQIQGCTAQGKLVWQTNLRLAETLTAGYQPPTASVRAEQRPIKTVPKPYRHRLIGMIVLAAIAGVIVGFWYTSRQSPTPGLTEATPLPTLSPSN